MNLLDHMPEELEAWMRERGYPVYRAGQVFAWLHKGAAVDEMRNIPAELRADLNRLPFGGASVLKKRMSALDGTAKYLYLLEDGNIIEGVLMRYKYGNTLCVSTQVGCRMGCVFCASTLEGLVRNLHPGEMLAQVLCVERELKQTPRAVTNIVLMGSGEPLDNYDGVVKFLRLVSCSQGINVGLRHISLSTCGLPEAMRRLADEGLPVTLSVSLHAPFDEERRRLMPVAQAFTVREVMDALRYYVKKTGRRAILEYALVAGENDTPACAQELARLTRGIQAHVNLIPLNAVPERGLKGSGGVSGFLNELTGRGVSATVRRSLGTDIEGACGQLRRSYLERYGESH